MHALGLILLCGLDHAFRLIFPHPPFEKFIEKFLLQYSLFIKPRCMCEGYGSRFMCLLPCYNIAAIYLVYMSRVSFL